MFIYLLYSSLILEGISVGLQQFKLTCFVKTLRYYSIDLGHLNSFRVSRQSLKTF